ncbi:MAG: carboxypeptidase-like regulatory domain-containing protein [Ferruginibacter sp.]
MKKIIASLLFSITCLLGFSQTDYTISGKIVDAVTKQPLQGASVFAENTTIGTASNNDGVFHLRLPNGGYSIVVTFTGYQTETKRITTADAGNQQIVIEIKQKEKEMQDVVIKASYEVKNGWEKYGDFFLDNFIGKTINGQQCFITNRDAIKFFYYKRKNLLKIMAEEPVEIVNDALGYNIKYTLDSFVHDYSTEITLYSGYPLFQEMQSSSIADLEKWNAARKIAYNGSILHFMRSMYNRKLKEEGFEIQFVIKDKEKEKAITLKNFYGAMNYNLDRVDNTVEINPNQKEVAVIYKDEETSALYRDKNPDAATKFQLSVLTFLPNESLDIERNGFYFEQNDITITGYWAWEKVGDMLPYDFNYAVEKEMPAATTEVITTITPVVPAVDTVSTNKAEQVVINSAGNDDAMLTNPVWKMEESRIIDGNKLLYYKNGGEENTVNFDNDFYKFNAGNTGIYTFKGQDYSFDWNYTDAAKTKMKIVIQYPSPLIVNLENIQLSNSVLKYTRLQSVNGANLMATETRVVK